jgi:uncharacterized membrane protein YtjA (UPF0391 family)
MLKWAIIFLVISLIAGALGLANISDFTRKIAYVLFGLFFLGFVIFLVLALLVVDAVSAPLALTLAME